MPESSPLTPATHAIPFVIRGHHLRHLAMVTNEVIQPDRLIEMTLVGGDFKSETTLPYTYREDLIGRSRSDAQRYRGSMRTFFQEYVQLEDNAPVRIVSNERDGICKSCIIGQHCLEDMPGDANAILVFQSALANLSDTYDVSNACVEYKTIEASSGGLEYRPHLDTNAKAVRLVLTHAWSAFLDGTSPEQMRSFYKKYGPLRARLALRLARRSGVVRKSL